MASRYALMIAWLASSSDAWLKIGPIDTCQTMDIHYSSEFKHRVNHEPQTVRRYRGEELG